MLSKTFGYFFLKHRTEATEWINKAGPSKSRNCVIQSVTTCYGLLWMPYSNITQQECRTLERLGPSVAPFLACQYYLSSYLPFLPMTSCYRICHTNIYLVVNKNVIRLNCLPHGLMGRRGEDSSASMLIWNKNYSIVIRALFQGTNYNLFHHNF